MAFFDLIEILGSYLQLLMLLLQIEPSPFPSWVSSPTASATDFFRVFNLDVSSIFASADPFASSAVRSIVPPSLPVDMRTQFLLITAVIVLFFATVSVFFVSPSKLFVLWYFLVILAAYLMTAGAVPGVLPEGAADISVAVGDPHHDLVFITGLVIGLLCIAGVIWWLATTGIRVTRDGSYKLRLHSRIPPTVTVAAIQRKETKHFDIIGQVCRLVYIAICVVAGLGCLDVIDLRFVLSFLSMLGPVSYGFAAFFFIIALFSIVVGVAGCFEFGRRLLWEYTEKGRATFLSILLLCLTFLFVPVASNVVGILTCVPGETGDGVTCPANYRLPDPSASLVPYSSFVAYQHPTSAAFQRLLGNSTRADGNIPRYCEPLDTLNFTNTSGACASLLAASQPQNSGGGDDTTASASSAFVDSNVTQRLQRSPRLYSDRSVICSDTFRAHFTASAIISLLSCCVATGLLLVHITSSAIDSLEKEFPLDANTVIGLTDEEVIEEKLVLSKTVAKIVYDGLLRRYRHWRVFPQLVHRFCIIVISKIYFGGGEQSTVVTAMALSMILHLAMTAAVALLRPYNRPAENILSVSTTATVSFVAIVGLAGAGDRRAVDEHVGLYIFVASLVILVPVVALVVGWIVTKSEEQEKAEQRAARIQEKIEAAVSNAAADAANMPALCLIAGVDEEAIEREEQFESGKTVTKRVIDFFSRAGGAGDKTKRRRNAMIASEHSANNNNNNNTSNSNLLRGRHEVSGGFLPAVQKTVSSVSASGWSNNNTSNTNNNNNSPAQIPGLSRAQSISFAGAAESSNNNSDGNERSFGGVGDDDNEGDEDDSSTSSSKSSSSSSSNNTDASDKSDFFDTSSDDEDDEAAKSKDINRIGRSGKIGGARKARSAAAAVAVAGDDGSVQNQIHAVGKPAVPRMTAIFVGNDDEDEDSDEDGFLATGVLPPLRVVGHRRAAPHMGGKIRDPNAHFEASARIILAAAPQMEGSALFRHPHHHHQHNRHQHRGEILASSASSLFAGSINGQQHQQQRTKQVQIVGSSSFSSAANVFAASTSGRGDAAQQRRRRGTRSDAPALPDESPHQHGSPTLRRMACISTTTPDLRVSFAGGHFDYGDIAAGNHSGQQQQQREKTSAATRVGGLRHALSFHANIVLNRQNVPSTVERVAARPGLSVRGAATDPLPLALSESSSLSTQSSKPPSPSHARAESRHHHNRGNNNNSRSSTATLGNTVPSLAHHHHPHVPSTVTTFLHQQEEREKKRRNSTHGPLVDVDVVHFRPFGANHNNASNNSNNIVTLHLPPAVAMKTEKSAGAGASELQPSSPPGNNNANNIVVTSSRCSSSSVGAPDATAIPVVLRTKTRRCKFEFGAAARSDRNPLEFLPPAKRAIWRRRGETAARAVLYGRANAVANNLIFAALPGVECTTSPLLPVSAAIIHSSGFGSSVGNNHDAASKNKSDDHNNGSIKYHRARNFWFFAINAVIDNIMLASLECYLGEVADVEQECIALVTERQQRELEEQERKLQQQQEQQEQHVMIQKVQMQERQQQPSLPLRPAIFEPAVVRNPLEALPADNDETELLRAPRTNSDTLVLDVVAATAAANQNDDHDPHNYSSSTVEGQSLNTSGVTAITAPSSPRKDSVAATAAATTSATNSTGTHAAAPAPTTGRCLVTFDLLENNAANKFNCTATGTATTTTTSKSSRGGTNNKNKVMQTAAGMSHTGYLPPSTLAEGLASKREPELMESLRCDFPSSNSDASSDRESSALTQTQIPRIHLGKTSSSLVMHADRSSFFSSANANADVNAVVVAKASSSSLRTSADLQQLQAQQAPPTAMSFQPVVAFIVDDHEDANRQQQILDDSSKKGSADADDHVEFRPLSANPNVVVRIKVPQRQQQQQQKSQNDDAPFASNNINNSYRDCHFASKSMIRRTVEEQQQRGWRRAIFDLVMQEEKRKATSRHEADEDDDDDDDVDPEFAHSMDDGAASMRLDRREHGFGDDEDEPNQQQQQQQASDASKSGTDDNNFFASGAASASLVVRDASASSDFFGSTNNNYNNNPNASANSNSKRRHKPAATPAAIMSEVSDAAATSTSSSSARPRKQRSQRQQLADRAEQQQQQQQQQDKLPVQEMILPPTLRRARKTTELLDLQRALAEPIMAEGDSEKLKRRIRRIYDKHQRSVQLRQEATDYRVNRDATLSLQVFFSVLGLAAMIALYVGLVGAVKTQREELSFFMPPNGVEKTLLRKQYEHLGGDLDQADLALAGYKSWRSFTESCCCVAFDNQTDVQALTVEKWLCKNGRVKERARRTARGVNALRSVRGLCETEFLNNCTLFVTSTPFWVTVNGCNSNVTDEEKALW